MFVSVVSADNEQIDIKESRQIVSKTINESTPWDAKEAAKIEDQIDNILMNTMLIKSYGLSTYNVQRVRTDTLDVPDDGYSSADGSYKLYKVNEQDSSYDYYILWMKATGMNNDDGLIPSYLREVKPGISLTNSNERITDWEPISDTYTSSLVKITVSLGVDHGGITAGVSQEFDLQSGHVGPDELSTSSGGYFRPHWSGNYQGSQGLIGGAEFRVPQGGGYHYDITLDVTGAGY
ncbi:hypothetical protein Mpet_0252 [Methanolacinia petrolearia DSM 11571]|uniref:Uncharacterized protein n=1 Tax=Methanolacinia petrolearia (strain DSM 11571 / OCM 486 / SEBR 4847) TaxID=679926 RepID=E1RF82_METP4|nr:hypothetical protein [Methanolacinia petrolearia]ADN35030.1 hypothetical protein Mpet_0252 [Methanolacinia petrolearia DSM 11571]